MDFIFLCTDNSQIYFLMTSFAYIFPCPYTLLHLLPTVIAQLHACGFSKDALTLIASYLSGRWQHFNIAVKINDTFSFWSAL